MQLVVTTSSVARRAARSPLLLPAFAGLAAWLGFAACVDPNTTPTTGVPSTVAPRTVPDLPPQSRVDDWNPEGLQTSTTVITTAGDNTGNTVTGLVAPLAGVGTERWLCNVGARLDDGILALSHEDVSSAAPNRFHLPEGGLATSSFEDRLYIASDTCVRLMYQYVDPPTNATPRWLIMTQGARQARLAVQSLQLHPLSQPAPITGTVDNWAPTDTCPQIGGPHGGNCEAGSSMAWDDYTMFSIATVDGSGATLTGLAWPGNSSPGGLGPIKILYNSGPGNVRLVSSSGVAPTTNNFIFGVTGDNVDDVVLAPDRGIILYHAAVGSGWLQIGHNDYNFTARDLNVSQGLVVQGQAASATVPGTELMVDHSLGATTTNNTGAYVRDVGAYDTTAGDLQAIGLIAATGAVRTAGPNLLTNIAGLFDARNGQANYAIETTGGNCYFGAGNQMQFYYVNSADADFSAQVDAEGGTSGLQTALTIGGNAFSGTAHRAIASAAAPTVDHGTLDASSTNFIGRVTAVGAFTSVTLGLGGGGFGATAFCIVQPEGARPFLTTVTPSATAPVIHCFDPSGAPASCPSFTYQCWGH